MNKNTNNILVITTLVAILSCSCSSQKKITYPIKFESNYNNSLPIYVIGHKNPDSDTICSSISYSHLLNELDCPAQPVSPGNLNGESQFVLNKFAISSPSIMSNAGNNQFSIMDHGTYNQSIDGMKEANILSVIDHHEIADIITSNPILYDAMPVGSTCSIVYKHYKEYNVSISKEMAGMMISGILSDTLGLRSPITTIFDKNAVEELMPISNISDYLAYTIEMLEAGNTYDKMTIEQILRSDYKNYNSGSTDFSVACVQSTNADQLKRIEDDMNSYMKDNFSSLEVDMCFVMMIDLVKFSTHLLCYGENALITAQKAFNVQSQEIILDNVVSRKLQIVPPLKKVLAN